MAKHTHWYMSLFSRMKKSVLLNGRYRRHIARIRKSKSVRIGFLVWENSKWSYEDLYQKCISDPAITPIILLVNTNHELVNMDKNLEFFKSKNHVIINDINDFKNQNIDIVFYEQPWFALTGDFTPINISKYALTLYVPYGIELDKNKGLMSHTYEFFQTVFRTYTFNNDASDELARFGIKNTTPVGHPRLDTFLTGAQNKNIWRSKNKTRIIYAPHHSFGNSILKQATWEWNGQHILQLARDNQDSTEWIFKPHPRFKLELGTILGSAEQAQQVFDDWAAVSTICDTGDYFDLFKTADLIISDCCSFKIEWLPTCKPFIQLISNYPDAYQYKILDKYTGGYYKAKTNADIDKFFNLLVHQHTDELYERRKQLATSVQLGASDTIYKLLTRIMK